MEIAELITILKRGEDIKTEFKQKGNIQSLSQSICAMANTEGGQIIIGVDDNGNIVGVDPKETKEKIKDAIANVRPYPKVDIETITIDSKHIVVVRVEKSNQVHTYRNVVYIRVGASNRPLSLEEIIEKASESLIIRFDELPSKAPLNAINKKLISRYLEEREKRRGVKKLGSIHDNMVALRIIIKKNNRYVPTNAGILFFSDTPQRWIPQSKVHLVWFRDEEGEKYSDSRFFDGPLWKIVDDIEDYFYRNLHKIGGELLGWRRTEIYEYPIRALREAIINAIIHRNYFDTSETKIFIYPKRIVIRNPGSFPPGVTPKNPIHKPRNPLLAQYMYDIGYTEKYGYGIKMMQEECERHPLVELEFNIRPYITEVIFKKTAKESIVDDTDKKIIDILRKYGELSSGEISQLLGKSKPTVIKRLKKLEKLGIIKTKGSGPARRYSLQGTL